LVNAVIISVCGVVSAFDSFGRSGALFQIFRQLSRSQASVYRECACSPVMVFIAISKGHFAILDSPSRNVTAEKQAII
jgi:hypothetical protein